MKIKSSPNRVVPDEMYEDDVVAKKRKTPLRDKILITILSLVITASVLFVAGVFLLNTRFLQEADTGNGGGGTLDQNITTPAKIKEKCVNFLVVGIANYDGDTGERGKLTDTIMLISFDIQANTINVLQVPRDTYVGDASSTGKINAVYGRKDDGGIDGLAKHINNMFNITIDHYVTLNMSAFITIVDTLGGVYVDVPNHIELEGAIIEPGYQKLTGWQSEKFVRERHSYANQDIGRLEMQRVFMNAFLKQVMNMGTKDVVALIPTMLKNLTTDLTASEIISFYKELSEVNVDGGIKFHMVPFVGARGNAFVSVKKLPTADLLNESFRPYTPDVSADDLYGIIELVTDYEYIPPDSGDTSSADTTQ